ncbi:hypothetical protein [Nostoc sp.]
MQRQTCNYFRLGGRRHEEPTGDYMGCKARLEAQPFVEKRNCCVAIAG